MKSVLFASALLLSGTALASNYEKLGDWLVNKEENKLTDQTDYYATLPAKDRDVALILRCQNNTTEAYLSTRDYIGGGYSSKVTLRIDKGKPVNQLWGVGESGSSLFSPKPVALIKSLTGKTDLIVGYSPYGKTQVITEFNMENIDKVAKELSSACNWKL